MADMEALRELLNHKNSDPQRKVGVLLKQDDLRDLLEQRDLLRSALEAIAKVQPQTLEMIQSNGFIFDDIGREPGNWKHLAFSIYTDLCVVESIARSALELK